jgi:hypothetical protein
MDGFNVIDPKGPMPGLAAGGDFANGLPTGGGGKVPAYT